MPTPWTDDPATPQTPIRAIHINELRTAVDNAGGTPPGGWTDHPITATTPIRAVHFPQIQAAIQGLWDRRTLGLIPQWSAGSGPAPDTPIRANHINDLRRWFNHYETWGDLRGVHWFESALTDLPRVGWNVETVIGVQDQNGNYNVAGVNDAHDEAEAARNYGLVNITRLDYRPFLAAPGPNATQQEIDEWISDFYQAVNALKDVSTIFIVGNEPTVEGEFYGQEYASRFNDVYSSPQKPGGVAILTAGPAAWSFVQRGGPPAPYESDLDWLAAVANNLQATDGFALHTYESIEEGCTDPRQPCGPPVSGGDRGFRRYRDYIERIKNNWAGKPVYLTEFNTHGFANTGPNDRVPQDNYPTGFMQQAYEEVRNYNTETNPIRASYPRILCLCWFVDDSRGNATWAKYALSNSAQPRLVQARADFIASDTSTGITS